MSRLLLELSFWLSRSNPKSELLVVIIIAVVGAIVVWLFNNIASRASWMFSRKMGSIPKRPFPNIIDQAPVRLNVCPVYPVLSAIQQDRHWGTKRFCYRNQCKLNLQTMISNMVTSILSVRDLFFMCFSTLQDRGRHWGKNTSNLVFPGTLRRQTDHLTNYYLMCEDYYYLDGQREDCLKSEKKNCYGQVPVVRVSLGGQPLID